MIYFVFFMPTLTLTLILTLTLTLKVYFIDLRRELFWRGEPTHSVLAVILIDYELQKPKF